MTQIEPAPPEFTKLLSELSIARSTTAKRAVLRGVPNTLLVENVGRIIESTEPELRRQLVAACRGDAGHAGVVYSTIRRKLKVTVPDTVLAHALTDVFFDFMSAPHLARYVKALPLLDRVQLLSRACEIMTTFSVAPSPKLKRILKDATIAVLLFAYLSSDWEVKRLVVKSLVPEVRRLCIAALVEGVRNRDDNMWELLIRTPETFQPEEREVFVPTVATLTTEASVFSAEDGAARLAALARSYSDAIATPLFVELAGVLCDRGQTLCEQVRLCLTLWEVAERFDIATASAARGTFGSVATILRTRQELSVGDTLALGAPRAGKVENVAFLCCVGLMAPQLERCSGKEIREIGEGILSIALAAPEVLLEIGGRIVKPEALSMWFGAIVEQVSVRLVDEELSEQLAVPLGILAASPKLSQFVREDIFERFIQSRLHARKFWAAVLDQGGLTRSWQSLVAGRSEEISSSDDSMRERFVKEGYALGQARAASIYVERLKGLTRAASMTSQLISGTSGSEGTSRSVRLVLNDLLTVLSAFGIKPAGEIGLVARFDPAIHEDLTGSAVPGEEISVCGLGFSMDVENSEVQYLSRIPVRPRR